MAPDQDLIVFDGDCIFCSGFARFMSRHDHGRFRFVTAASPLGRSLCVRHGLDPDAVESNIVLTGGIAHQRLGAFAAAMATLDRPWRWLAVLGRLPAPAGDWLYFRIARNRYLFGRRACPMPSAELRGRLVE
jgi:predicted DCC family thiol-disulfide oxidoreductase YuxK